VDHLFCFGVIHPCAEIDLVNLSRSPPRGIIGTRPAVGDVVIVADRVIALLPPRRGDVHGFAGLQLHARRDDVNVAAAVALSVPYGIVGVLVSVETSKGDALEVVQDSVDLLLRRSVVLVPGNHCRGVAMLKRQRIGQRCDQLRIAAQHCDRFALLALVVKLLSQILFG
jgi:hypothetical protein